MTEYIKQIPNNIEAEEAALGAIFRDPSKIDLLVESLTIDDFYRSSHKIIFKTMLILNNKKQPIDIITLIEYLRKCNKLTDVGGIAFITALSNKVPSASNIKYYINIIKEKSILRHTIYTAEHIINMIYNNETSPTIVLDKAEQMLNTITKKFTTTEINNIQQQTLKAYMDVENIINHKNKLLGLETGLKDLDQVLQGLKNSDFIVLAARPSMGKTAFALNIASHLSIKKNISVAFFSLEMSTNQLIYRIFSSYGYIPLRNLKSGNLSNEDTQNLITISNKLAESKLIINDDNNISNLYIFRSVARKLKRENDIKLIIIDYLQLLECNRRENRHLEISEISRSLKLLAKELNIPIIALSQLSRSVESRQIKKPMLSDLRESGSIEQDADIVMFLYREDYYNIETENKNITEVIIAKNRNGPTASIPVYFHSEYVRFQDLVKD